MIKTWIDRIKRHAFLIAVGAFAWVYAVRGSSVETVMLFLALLTIGVILTGFLLHALTHIEWSKWEGNDEFEKVGKAIVIAAVFLGVCIVQHALFSQHEQTTAIGTMNEELQQK